MTGTLRIVDAGTVEPLRSQALWHGIASAMDAATPPTLSFCRPGAPYVGLGYHRSLAELDLEACRRLGLPVIRRRIGGGPVYLDSDQLFFQITVPAGLAPARVDRLYERFLEPAAAAFRNLGLDARRNGLNDLAAGPHKVSGTGAGRIGDGVTVVGNVLFRFPHERMVEVLALPGDRLRRECLRLMRRHVTSLADAGLAVSAETARAALVDAYARALDRRPLAAELGDDEEAAIRRWEKRFQDPAWLVDPGPPARRATRQIKISADARIVWGSQDAWEVEASIVDGRLERVFVALPAANGLGEEIARALAGQPARSDALRALLEPFGDAGRRVHGLFEPGLRAL